MWLHHPSVRPPDIYDGKPFISSVIEHETATKGTQVSLFLRASLSSSALLILYKEDHVGGDLQEKKNNLLCENDLSSCVCNNSHTQFWSFDSANSLLSFIASSIDPIWSPVACAETSLPPPLPPITSETCCTHSFAFRPFATASWNNTKYRKKPKSIFFCSHGNVRSLSDFIKK